MKRLHLAILSACFGFFLLRFLSGRDWTDALRILSVVLGIAYFLAPQIRTRMQTIDFTKSQILIFCVFLFCFQLLFVLSRLLRFDEVRGFDFAIFAQILNFDGHQSLPFFKSLEGGVSHYAFHFSPLFHLFSVLAGSSYGLVFVVLLKCLLPALTVWIGGRAIAYADHPQVRTAMWLACISLIAHPFYAGMLTFDFHEVDFLPFLAALFVYGIFSKRNVIAFGSVVAALAVKETVPLALLPLALVVLILWPRSSYQKLAGWAALLSVASFALFYLVILPSYGLKDTRYISNLVYLGNSKLEILLSPILRPTVFWRTLVSWSSAQYIFMLSMPFILFLWISLQKQRWMLLSFFPYALILLLFRSPHYRDPYFHYGVETVSLLFAASLLFFFYNQSGSVRVSKISIFVVSYALWMLSSSNNFMSDVLKLSKKDYWTEGTKTIHRLRALPPQDVFSDSISSLPFLADRPNLSFVESERWVDATQLVLRTSTLEKESFPRDCYSEQWRTKNLAAFSLASGEDCFENWYNRKTIVAPTRLRTVHLERAVSMSELSEYKSLQLSILRTSQMSVGFVRLASHQVGQFVQKGALFFPVDELKLAPSELEHFQGFAEFRCYETYRIRAHSEGRRILIPIYGIDP